MINTRLRLPRIASLAALALLASCSGESEYLKPGGGGFIFNYRNAEASYGLILFPTRDPPAGAIIEVSFENPAGGEPILVSRPARGGGRIDFQTPPVTGVEKGKRYQVVAVLRAANGDELQRIAKSFASEVDQSMLPERPLAIGPGYQRNIDDSEEPFPPSIFRTPPAGKPE
jgi:hypothetical protein